MQWNEQTVVLMTAKRHVGEPTLLLHCQDTKKTIQEIQLTIFRTARRQRTAMTSSWVLEGRLRQRSYILIGRAERLVLNDVI